MRLVHRSALPIRRHRPSYPAAQLRKPGFEVTLFSMETVQQQNLVVVVDDEEPVREAVSRMLKAAGLTVRAFASAEDLLKSGLLNATGCVITDIRMPGMSGLELLAELNARHCPIPTILITAHGDENLRMHAMRAGVVKFLAKPVDGETLLASVQAALQA
jgi:FixJ family two-component response regulator